MFFVFGVSKTLALNTAKKKTKLWTGTGKNRKDLAPDEYENLVKANAQNLFEKIKPQKLSHSLSTPELCRNYIALANKNEDHRDLHIKYRVPTGKINPKTKREIMEWKIAR